MSPRSRLHRHGAELLQIHQLDADHRAWRLAALARKEAMIDEIMAPLARPEQSVSRVSVRIMFDRAVQGVTARVDERAGERIVFEVTEGAWIDLHEAEGLAQFYAAARELPVSRTDLPL